MTTKTARHTMRALAAAAFAAAILSTTSPALGNNVGVRTMPFVVTNHTGHPGTLFIYITLSESGPRDGAGRLAAAGIDPDRDRADAAPDADIHGRAACHPRLAHTRRRTISI
jgi:hypothetical protein